MFVCEGLDLQIGCALGVNMSFMTIFDHKLVGRTLSDCIHLWLDERLMLEFKDLRLICIDDFHGLVDNLI